MTAIESAIAAMMMMTKMMMLWGSPAIQAGRALV